MTLLALQSLEVGKLCAKRWRADGTVEEYGRAYWWRPYETMVDGIDDLAAVLTRLQSRSDLCVVRGTLIDPSATRIRRALVCIADGDRPWVCCDLDTIATPADLRAELLLSPSGGIDLVGRYARALLPEWLRDVTIVAQWSQSAGRDGYALAKLHLWAWLTRPVCCASLAAWADGVELLDPAVCRPVQPIYTSDPIIEDGWTSGPTRRIAIVRGSVDAATPPREIEDLATWTARRARDDAERAERARRYAEADRYRSPVARESRGLRRLAGAITAALGEMSSAPVSRRHGTLIRCAASIVRTAADVGVDASEGLRELADVARARLPSERAGEVDEAISYARSCR